MWRIFLWNVVSLLKTVMDLNDVIRDDVFRHLCFPGLKSSVKPIISVGQKKKEKVLFIAYRTLIFSSNLHYDWTWIRIIIILFWSSRHGVACTIFSKLCKLFNLPEIIFLLLIKWGGAKSSWQTAWAPLYEAVTPWYLIFYDPEKDCCLPCPTSTKIKFALAFLKATCPRNPYWVQFTFKVQNQIYMFVSPKWLTWISFSKWNRQWSM